MKEELKKIVIDRLPETEEEFLPLMSDLIATPEGTAAAMAAALYVAALDREEGLACLSDLCFSPPDRETFDAIVPYGDELAEIARSYLHKNGPSGEDEGATVMIKLTGEKPLKKRMKTVYVGCSSTASYRPLTLISRPPKFYKKRFGVKREYYEDPWFVAEFPSMVLPVPHR
ncbi:MAG: hypothetical protein J5950_01880 [Clostridia bacterium]|nr:hypothetical protein [Clostridia bacterium]